MTPNTPLGRGLGSLIPLRSNPTPTPAAPPAPAPVAPPPAPVRPASPTPPVAPRFGGSGKLYDIPISSIDPNPHQPRHHIQNEAFEELIDSIKQHGIIQPLIVSPDGERFQLIAGERRFRAAERLGLPTVPAVVRESKELEKLELAIVENVQRQDLNPVEEALAYQQLCDEFGLTQEDVARKVGKRRTTVANALRLLALPPDMQRALRAGTITASHAKILLAAVTPQERERLFQQITEQSLPVRAAAQLGQRTTVRRRVRRSPDPVTQAVEDELRSRLGTKVKVSKREGRGSINIEFYSEEEFQQLITRLG